MLAKVCCCLHHAPRVARGAHAPALTGEGHKVVVSAIVTPDPGNAMDEDAELQIFAKGLADIGLGGVVVTLPVELPRAGKFMPRLEMLGYVLVQQRALRKARVVELGFCTGLHGQPENASHVSYRETS